MIIFLFGKEKYLISKRLFSLKTVFEDKNKEAAVFDFDLEENFDEKMIKEAISSGGGLFSSKKMVVLRNVAGLNGFDADGLKEELKSVRKNEELIVIIAETHSKDEKGKLIAYLKKSAKVEKFDKLNPAEMKKWIVTGVEEKSGGAVKIENVATERLSQISKGDLWRVSGELDKLVNFVDEGVITIDNINDFCHGDAEAKIFDLVDAIGQKKAGEAIALKRRLINQGENEFYIFKMIMFQVRNILRVGQCLKKGIRDSRMISEKLGLHPFVVQKTLRQLSGFDEVKLKQVYGLAADLDLKSKSGEVKMGEVLDYFILKI